MPKKSLITATQDAAGEGHETQAPQTDLEINEMSAEAPGIQIQDGENAPASQTDLESGEISDESEAEGADNSASPQTDSDSVEFTADGPGLQAKSNNITPDPQTDLEIKPDMAGKLVSAGENPPISQTDSESGTDEGTYNSHDSSIASVATSDDTSLHTGMETGKDSPGSAAQSPDYSNTPPESQTGSEAEPKSLKSPRRRSTKSQSGENGENQTPADDNTPKPARRRRTRVEPVLAIDEQRSVETQEDKLKNDLLDLVESQKGRKILTGTIQGVERSADNPNLSFAVIYHGAFKVIIPAEETVQPPEDFRDRSPADVMHYLVTKRLGAEIDYIVKGVDVKSGIAAASRLDAMAQKRRQYYFGTDRDGNNLIYEDLSAEARVVSVIRAGMFVDLFGLEVYIPLRELSYQRWIDAAAHFQAGQRVLVKILRLDRSDRDNIRVSASVKQAGENPYEQALKRYTPGSRYVGTVSIVDTNGVFVSLEGGIDCLCSYPKRGRPPRGARVTVRIIGVNHENNRIWGAITHMTTAR